METMRYKDFINKDTIWLEDPRKYVYLRESNWQGETSRSKPIKKGEYDYVRIGEKWNPQSYRRLIGWEKKRMEPGIFGGKFWWLKGYDKGMPDQEIGYGKKGASPSYAPAEAVKFI